MGINIGAEIITNIKKGQDNLSCVKLGNDKIRPTVSPGDTIYERPGCYYGNPGSSHCNLKMPQTGRYKVKFGGRIINPRDTTYSIKLNGNTIVSERVYNNISVDRNIQATGGDVLTLHIGRNHQICDIIVIFIS